MEVSVDFKVLPNSEYLLVITDDYSRYPIVEIITSTAAKVVIPLIDKVFAEFGAPHTLKSDNGSPFQSDDFCKVCQLPWFQAQANYVVLAKTQRRMRTLYENLGQMHQNCYRRRSFIQAKSACFLAELSCDATSNYWHQPCHCAFRQSYLHTTTRTERHRTR